jgi:phosphatidylglycerol lysyltransferase
VQTRGAGDPEAAAKIIRAYGSSSLAYFALGRDKSYFLNEYETAVVAYSLRNGVALAVGDPIGPPEDHGPMVKSFRGFCKEEGWLPAFHSVHETSLALYAKAGFKTLKIGEEALIDVQAFDVKGRAKSDLREAVNRGRRNGWQLLFFDRPIEDESLKTQITAISEEWLTHKFGGEFGFTMSGTPLSGSNETLVTAAVDTGGHVMAFMTLAPMYGVRGWAGDFLRGSRDSPPGVIDYLVVSTIFRLRERGDQILSLGLAPLANETSDGADKLFSSERVLALIYNRFNIVYHFKSLYRFKRKFGPRWENRYLAYPSPSSLPRVIYAFLSLHTPHFRIVEVEVEKLLYEVESVPHRLRGLTHRSNSRT